YAACPRKLWITTRSCLSQAAISFFTVRRPPSAVHDNNHVPPHLDRFLCALHRGACARLGRLAPRVAGDERSPGARLDERLDSDGALVQRARLWRVRASLA